jgi:HPt (histidine-containing phosphotransfer) domain-containing protein
MDHLQPLTLDVLKENFGDDNHTFIQILEVFLAEVPDDVQTLNTLIETSEFKDAGNLAHKLKSNYRLLGMEFESMILQEIEYRGKNLERIEEIATLFQQFMVNYDNGMQQVSLTKTHLESYS